MEEDTQRVPRCDGTTAIHVAPNLPAQWAAPGRRRTWVTQERFECTQRITWCDCPIRINVAVRDKGLTTEFSAIRPQRHKIIRRFFGAQRDGNRRVRATTVREKEKAPIMEW